MSDLGNPEGELAYNIGEILNWVRIRVSKSIQGQRTEKSPRSAALQIPQCGLALHRIQLTSRTAVSRHPRGRGLTIMSCIVYVKTSNKEQTSCYL